MATVKRTVSYRHTAGPYIGATAALNLIYDDTQPYDVTIDFGPAGSPWKVWRDVLAERVIGQGVTHCDGRTYNGGFACSTAGIWSYLTFANHTCTVTLRLIAADLAAFLRRTDEIVPPGAETFDIGAELNELLKDSAR